MIDNFVIISKETDKVIAQFEDYQTAEACLTALGKEFSGEEFVLYEQNTRYINFEEQE